jgi:hypothetical protein
VVLMGGQALDFWADAHGILSSAAAVGPTRDIDFMTSRPAPRSSAFPITSGWRSTLACP